MNRKGFSLVELLCVIVILALLMLLVSGTFNNVINKSKETISEAQERSILSAAEKWSVDNSEEFDDIEGKKIQIGLDVIFILDISGSMEFSSNKVLSSSGSRITRGQAMTEATNEAITVLFESNSNNRIGIVLFGNSGETFVPLDSYTTSSSYYLKYTPNTNGQYGKISTASLTSLTTGVKKSYSKQLQNLGTQLATGVNQAWNIFNSQTVSDVRIPVVIILTDGDDFYPSTAIETITSKKSSIARKYNSATYVYTIGFGIQSGSKAALTLNPTAEAIEYAIANNTAAKSLATTLKRNNKDYDYADGSFIGSMDATQLTSIFTSIAGEVIEATKITQVCVTVKDLYDGGYLSKKDFEMADGEAVSTYVIMNYNEATNQYNFSLAKTAKQESDCEKLLSQ